MNTNCIETAAKSDKDYPNKRDLREAFDTACFALLFAGLLTTVVLSIWIAFALLFSK